jgi:hypothetical protein
MAAVHWMVNEAPRVDLHTVLKTCYFADKAHLNKHGRPIFGATYQAMRFGPVPLEIYEMTKGEAIWLPEAGTDHYPWTLEGYRLSLHDNTPPDMSVFSRSDIEELRSAFGICAHMSFDGRTAATHGADWRAAELGHMKYEDMIDDGPKKAETVKYLQENARFMRL